jgi:UDP-glucose 4-epimerase
LAADKHILVTGGAGFIGSHLVERLLSDGHSVVVLDDCSTGRKENLAAVWSHNRFQFLEGRISERKDLTEIVGGAASVYHLAAAVGVDLVMKSALGAMETNLRETQCLLDAANASQTPILLTSTSEVYGKSVKDTFSEEDDLLIGPPHFSRWSYACSKLMDEFLALAHMRERETPVVIARLFNTVGPRQTGRYGMALPRFIGAARQNKPLQVFGDGRQTRCFCFVKDTVEALVRLQNCPLARGEVFNIGSEEEVSIRQLAEKVIAALRSESNIEIVPYSLAYPQGFQDMLRRKPNIEKLHKFVQFRPQTSLDEIIHRAATVA